MVESKSTKAAGSCYRGFHKKCRHWEVVQRIGTGFSDTLQKEMMKQFEPLITKTSPFDYEVDVDKPTRFRPKRMGAKPTWLKPELVCEVGFAEVTSDGMFRQASFKGMRTDKRAQFIVAGESVSC